VSGRRLTPELQAAPPAAPVQVAVHERDERLDLPLAKCVVGGTYRVEDRHCMDRLLFAVPEEVHPPADARTKVAFVKPDRTEYERRTVRAELAVAVLSLERIDVGPVPEYALPARGTAPDDLRLFGHGKPRLGL
jgi:hypothetical protein